MSGRGLLGRCRREGLCAGFHVRLMARYARGRTAARIARRSETSTWPLIAFGLLAPWRQGTIPEWLAMELGKGGPGLSWIVAWDAMEWSPEKRHLVSMRARVDAHNRQASLSCQGCNVSNWHDGVRDGGDTATSASRKRSLIEHRCPLPCHKMAGFARRNCSRNGSSPASLWLGSGRGYSLETPQSHRSL